MRLVFIGPPGAGKGTQATRLAERLSLRYVATGDELRKAIAAGTPLGDQARTSTDSGQLVPDQLHRLRQLVLRAGQDLFVARTLRLSLRFRQSLRLPLPELQHGQLQGDVPQHRSSLRPAPRPRARHLLRHGLPRGGRADVRHRVVHGLRDGMR